jgi:hypothetical protein
LRNFFFCKRAYYEHYERDDGVQNRPYLFDKKTKQSTPPIERDGMLEIPVHLFLLSEKRPAHSAGLAAGGGCAKALAHDVLPKLNGNDADFLMHRRLTWTPSCPLYSRPVQGRIEGHTES